VRRPDLNGEGNIAESNAEQETLYEVKWDPSEMLDLQKYSKSLEQLPEQGEAPRQLNVVSEVAKQQSKDVHKARRELMKKGIGSECRYKATCHCL
jgi:hypothetical protein